ncbi:MAG: riboflavin biosynthesis protein RibF [Synergistaceae bacterium]|nr:riboflavin biosynthesis protein RibF [Synergistaceae bacterium]
MLITIGAFDGFHKGHAQLLRLCREKSGGKDWGVMTFSPHPAQFMRKLPHTLFTSRERELIRRVLGIPKMYVLEFSSALRNLSPGTFIQMIRERFGVDGIVMGSDFRLGRDREGSAESLSKLVKVITVPLLDKSEYSSSNARKCFAAGNVEEAAEIFGYPPFMISRVLHGRGRGHAMSFPTANIDITDRIIPAFGVYASAVLVNGEWHCGAVSVGTNPTFGDVSSARCEVHIEGFDGDIYGTELPVFFLGRVRDMKKFSCPEELAAQIEHDITECRRIYRDATGTAETRRFLDEAQRVYSRQELSTEVIRLVEKCI